MTKTSEHAPMQNRSTDCDFQNPSMDFDIWLQHGDPLTLTSRFRLDQPRKEDGKLQNEIAYLFFFVFFISLRVPVLHVHLLSDERKAQFQNGWQKTSLYPDWRKEFFQTVDITLDPATAHPSLFLSEGNRHVTWGEKSQDLPEDPQRFCSLPCVLGHQVMTSGRWHWEVEVESHGTWDLGICRPHVMRKGRVCIKPEDGF
nr:PREDICTED: butyrophilin subfamily 2 member A2-like [Bos mutus]